MTDRYESRASTHADDCWSWGPGHYKCAVREIERLRKMHQDAYQRGLQAGSRGLREMYDAIQEVKRQDAWGNTRLTEALMAAEERAERAEAENKRLREELSKMRAEPSDETLRLASIIGKHFKLPGNACRAHAAIAEVLRAQPAASAEPSDGEIRSEQVRRMAEDAARYRWLRSLNGACDAAACVTFNIGFDWIEQHGAELDAAIDEAMEKEVSND